MGMTTTGYSCSQRDFLTLKCSLQKFESQTPHKEITKSYHGNWMPSVCSDWLAVCDLLFWCQFCLCNSYITITLFPITSQHMCECVYMHIQNS